jgi:hypothetical protein
LKELAVTTNFKAEHKDSSDQELLDAWADAQQPNSEQSQQLLEIMQFRAAMAQNRAAIAAENYTKLTFCLLVVTAIGVLLSLFSK